MDESRIYIRTRRETDEGMYVQIDIVESEAGEITILVSDKKLVPKVKHVDLYRPGKDGTFIRQPFQILKRKKTREGLLLRVSRIGATKSAEMRQSTRVPTRNVRARVGDQEDCEVLDIGARGLAVVSNEIFEVGVTVPIALCFEGETHSGEATVRSVREPEPGQFRYGMQCTGSDSALKAALPRIAMQLQLMPAPADD